ncbi:[LSU ribosomal protein L11P]-lysine N-methyltransferase [Sulfuritortus calidifontis]|uniref:Ribosomal protein L11 methyltransferase n=1 Tax=Sulfuritortus calidifontis TaxID=1914471 RepID=A0A4R3JW72_9PROT|nr:50S ribosomal protein L11 methyltransferase [Sulfuritortus calidifontis]TCS71301.1 [LSU ribosomal protein L11P]-lysine N-methyltransferase [Sulfuritortus calidifontis]
MAWLSLKLPADADQAEAWSDALMAAGALSVSIEDRDAGTEAEQPQFGEPGLDEPKSWQRNWVEALLPAEADVPGLLAEAARAAKLALPADYQVEQIEEQDWVRLTQSQFEPIRISHRLWIVPSWHQAPDPQAISIELDPGLAFGTGSHPTTRLCLRWLEQAIRGGESVLDYGCGSGILAIAAAKLGAGRVVGVDIDPQAVTASRDNAERNKIEAMFCLADELPKLPDSLSPNPPPEGEGAIAEPKAIYDILVANILTNPLRALLPLLAARVRCGGRIALSGILEAQADEILAAYASAFDMRLWATEEGWVCLEGVKRC